MLDRTPLLPVAHRLIERLTTIKLHANSLRRGLGREPRPEPAVTMRHLTAIDQEVDAAVALVRGLAEGAPSDGVDGA
jgi:hypothetical protein